MKKLDLLIKTVFLLCALVGTTTSVWATDNYTYTFTNSSGIAKGSNTLASKAWTLALDPNDAYLANEAAGLHIGSGKKGIKTITLSSSAFTGVISKVVVNTKGNGSNGTVAVTVNGIAYTAKNNINSIGSTSADLEFTGNQTGEIIITLGYPAKQDKNIYVSRIDVTYNYAAPTATLESITLGGSYPTEFYVGQDFSHEGMTVTANYSDNSTVDVTTDATFTGYDMDTASDQTVTVSYSGKTTTYDIVVNENPIKSIVDFIAEASAATGKKCRCYLMGKVSNIASTKYGNFTLTDNSGSIYIYGTLTPAKETQKFSTLGIEEGDYVKVLAEQYVLFNETDEASNVVFVKEMGKETTPAVSDAGWATYVTVNSVRFANGDAFVVASASDKVYMESATDVPANTPVVLKGAGVKTAMVLDDAPAAPTNALAVSTGGTVDGYVLSKKNSVVGFYKWAGGSLTSGKVYLPSSAVTSSSRDFIGFEGDVTGINEVKNQKETVEGIFDLQGRKVITPSKGLYIVNGKKVVIK